MNTLMMYIAGKRKEAREYCQTCRAKGFEPHACNQCPMFSLVAFEDEESAWIEQVRQEAITEACDECPKIDKLVTQEQLNDLERTIKQVLEAKKKL